jgi:hypothetical protein
MYNVYEIINTTEHQFSYVFIKPDVGSLVSKDSLEVTYMRDLVVSDANNILTGYNLIKDSMSEFGPSYSRIDTPEDLQDLYEKLGM